MDLKILTTGGTIDKIYFDAKSEFQVGDPHIHEVLAEANVSFSYQVESLMRKDSLDMDEADRQLIVAHLLQEVCPRILITHGTDTMVETARALVPVKDKTIVLTGSMQPGKLRQSDAVFNIGYALAATQILPPGVYIAMNGRIFDPLITSKNVKANRFET
ncbi:asparaginase domain-containing protein [Desulfogranum mediterraneum]|uniref:asparaginase domain-containing protein n=1 Tax=Desulfogranum mediterraneum TaxID=160661 RepID=UPI0003F4F222|nr:asparaginase domain-containing protein [Desulfogranum mediterraneum]